MGGRPRIDGIGMAATLAFAATGLAVTPPAAEPPTDCLEPALAERRAHRSLRTGMSPAEVVAVLGAPHVVTRGAAGHEAWVWLGVARDALEIDGDASGLALLAGAGIELAGTMLTLVARFDEVPTLTCVRLLASRPGGRTPAVRGLNG